MAWIGYIQNLDRVLVPSVHPAPSASDDGQCYNSLCGGRIECQTMWGDVSFSMVNDRVCRSNLPCQRNEGELLCGLTLPSVASISRTGLSAMLVMKQYVSGAVVLALGYQAAACMASGCLNDRMLSNTISSFRMGLLSAGLVYAGHC